MALKFKINKAKYDALSDELKNEYIAGEKDGEYVLDVAELPQGEDVEPVKRALASEREKNKNLTSKVRELQTTIDNAPDVEALKTEHGKEVGKYKSFTEKTLIDNAALALATKISTSPALLLPHIKSRLIADMTGDEPVTKVLGADGKPSDMTIDKLGEEFVANADFKTIIKASNGTGGGTPPNPSVKPLGGGMPPKTGEQGDAPDFSKLPPKDFAAHLKAKAEAKAQAQQ
ncbi:MAG: hypothetical protein CMQ11_07115 [Gammaproteobacteria bacterium]|nr:hypothetical protein [Gammaproteobacteria bacterium]